ncbi:unnamed protein product [Schistocephalus solidus]|uniref:C2H2-type domain-containing protein n=1 Tax=Schistocephalus solidus TaxID=70667 RepID=A0A183SMZ9_SCHSO|nr:unnamed protein product [Schistocephalus solidus]
MPKPCQRTFRARFGLVGNLRIRCNNNPATSTSATPASNPTTANALTTNEHSVDTPSPTINDTILLSPPVAPIEATYTTCTTPATLVATSNCYLLPPTPPFPNTTAGDSVLTCSHCDRTFTSHIGLVGHLRIHRRDKRTSAWSTNTEQRPPPPMPSLSTRIHLSHGPDRSHAYPRQRNPLQCQHILRTHQNFLYSYHELEYQYQQQSPPPRLSASRPILSTLSLHMHITHRPSRLLANPPQRVAN